MTEETSESELQGFGMGITTGKNKAQVPSHHLTHLQRILNTAFLCACSLERE